MATDRKDIPQHFYSLEEYFAFEAASDARFEYWDGEIVCMSGGSQEHTQISGNVFFRLRLQLGGGPCRAFIANTPVKTPTLPPYRYPDVTVACGEPLFEHIRGVDALLNPVLLVEVLSPSTASCDHAEKFIAYQAISTFREYLLISEDAPHLTRHRRQPDSRCDREEVTGMSAMLTLESINVTLSLNEIYEDVKFS